MVLVPPNLALASYAAGVHAGEPVTSLVGPSASASHV